MEHDHDCPVRRRRLVALTGALATSIGLSGCLDTFGSGDSNDGDDDNGSGNSDGNGDGGSSTDEDVAELARQNRQFAFDLYEELVGVGPDENLFYSPHSISLALAMTYAGARGETAEQMADTLRYTLGEDIHAAIEALAEELESRSDVDTDDEDGEPFRLDVESTVWGQEEYPFYQDYLDLLEAHYGAGLRAVDFRSDPESARETINQWVEEQTAEKVEELLPEGSITRYARLVLTNAIYFRASWRKQFDETSTEDAEFTALDGSTTAVPMMRQSESFPYAEVDGHQLIELPYVGDDVGMVIVLPAEGEFEALEEELDPERFDELVDELVTSEGELRLPRFEYGSSFSLGEILTDMGMPIPFDSERADFSGIVDLEETGENLFIHDAYHDAHVSVDEDGTEAAAATGVVVGTESAPADPFEMVVDRPFLFAIRDRPTDALLFFGRVVDAAAAQP